MVWYTILERWNCDLAGLLGYEKCDILQAVILKCDLKQYEIVTEVTKDKFQNVFDECYKWIDRRINEKPCAESINSNM